MTKAGVQGWQSGMDLGLYYYHRHKCRRCMRQKFILMKWYPNSFAGEVPE